LLTSYGFGREKTEEPTRIVCIGRSDAPVVGARACRLLASRHRRHGAPRVRWTCL